MAPRFSTSNCNERKPLIEVNRELRTGLASIPEIAKPKGNDRNNVSHAVFVRDGLGHNVDEDPEKESDGKLVIILVRNSRQILLLVLSKFKQIN